MRLRVIACDAWHEGTCSRPDAVAQFGARPSAGVCARACGRGTLTGETIEVGTPGVQPVPRDEWPAWASWLAERATDADKGVGDTLDRMLGSGGSVFKLLWHSTFGKLGIDCGCAGRRAKWNAMYRY